VCTKATTPKAKAKAKAMTFEAKPTTSKAKAKPSTVYLAKHLEISSNSKIQRITHMQMFVPRCHNNAPQIHECLLQQQV